MLHEREKFFTQVRTPEDRHVLQRMSPDFGELFFRKIFLVEVVQASIQEPFFEASIALELD